MSPRDDDGVVERPHGPSSALPVAGAVLGDDASALEVSPGGTTQLPSTRRGKPGVLRAGVKYGVVGASGVLVNLAILYLCHSVLGWGFTRSSALATEAAIVWNYVGNELWTFHHRRLSLRRLVKFNTAALATLLVTVTTATIIERFTDPLLAQLIGIVAGSSLNFAANFLWTWRH